MSTVRFTWQSAMLRALIGLLGGFGAALSFMVGTSATLIGMDWMPRVDAVAASGMLAFLVWAIAVLVAFGAASVQRAAGWILGSGAGFAALGWGCLRSMSAA